MQKQEAEEKAEEDKTAFHDRWPHFCNAGISHLLEMDQGHTRKQVASDFFGGWGYIYQYSG